MTHLMVSALLGQLKEENNVYIKYNRHIKFNKPVWVNLSMSHLQKQFHAKSYMGKSRIEE